ncbi:MAG: LapA family protein [Candidatus Zixiibacteriota bacterium]
MKSRTITLTNALFVMVAFIALNWIAIMIPATLSLGVATVQAPLGAVILGLLTLFTALFLAFVIYAKKSGFVNERHHSREMRVTRELADNAGNSRFNELPELLEAESKRHDQSYSRQRHWSVCTHVNRGETDCSNALSVGRQR